MFSVAIKKLSEAMTNDSRYYEATAGETRRMQVYVFYIYDDLTCVNLIQFNQLQYPPLTQEP